jgi:peroxiredoxin family protein
MIQFNLLPDVKQNFIKARRQKRMVMVISVISAATALGILVMVFMVVNFVQKTHLNNLNKDIVKYNKQLQQTQDLAKILTIQNQLNSLPALHDEKAITSRIALYATQVTPAQANIGKLNLDLSTSTLVVSGEADTLNTINKYADTLKFTTFETADKSKTGPAFSEVVLTNFTVGDDATAYELHMKFDPTIFDNEQEVALTVPKIISTRSETEKPAALFQSTGGTQ